MIDGKKVIAVIAARGGSKGLPGKNIMDVGGKPLIAWSILAARESSYIDRLILSSDDNDIIQVARQWGCEVPFRRPAALATDSATVEDTLIHALDSLNDDYDLLVLLQPTSPLRTTDDIDATIKTCIVKKAPACVSICKPDKSPYWMCRQDKNGCLHRLLHTDESIHRRQDLPPVYALNGAAYVAEIPWFRTNKSFLSDKTVGYEMPRERSADVDTALDACLVNAILANSDIDNNHETTRVSNEI